MTFPKLTQTVFYLAILFSGGLANAQDVVKAHDQVKQKHGDVDLGGCGAIGDSFVDITLDSIVKESTLIVRGKISPSGIRQRLTKNEAWIETDYQVKVLETYKGSTAPTTLTLSLAGGKIRFPEGWANCIGFYDWKRSDYPLPGQTYVFFLQKHPERDDVWRLADGATGAWRIMDGRIQAKAERSKKVVETWDGAEEAKFIEGVRSCVK